MELVKKFNSRKYRISRPTNLYKEINFNKYLFLVFIYLFGVVSASIASIMNIDVQNFYRIPVINIRWIDVAILSIVFNHLYSLAQRKRTLKNTNLIIFLCISYLVYESIQLIRTLGVIDIMTQLSLFYCSLSIFIIVDLSVYIIPLYKIVFFIKKISIWGAYGVIILNYYLLYSFFRGNIVIEDLDVRVAIKVIGSKETVYSFVLVPLVYAYGLYFIQEKGLLWKKILFIFALLSIYGALIITFWRGTVIMIVIITFYFLFAGSNLKQMIIRFTSFIVIITLGYFIFGGTLAEKGYDPLQKITETIQFATDVKNPDWDKGRAIAQDYAIKEWKNNLWFGAGYDELGRGKSMPINSINPHNGIITSLFHRGVFGTIIYMLILIFLFSYAVKGWILLRNYKSQESEIVKIFILVSLFWIITFMTQEALWEKYSLSIEYLYLGLITNIYKQIV
ncbi:O-antigen ligase family protein [Spirosoma flavum]|uniref:O-antigen ligase family protein n=1 Tax=Spirosoma flavum TaxID=2048557 RepID=A0ABW6AP25_9BACT